MARRKANAGDRVEFYMGRENGWHSGTVRCVTQTTLTTGRGGAPRKVVYYWCDNGDPDYDDSHTNGCVMLAIAPARYIRKKETT